MGTTKGFLSDRTKLALRDKEKKDLLQAWAV
jgi:hypothetical protein